MRGAALRGQSAGRRGHRRERLPEHDPQCEDYVYITTPYLILSDEMQRTLRLAASSGVDVRIITPGIPDKKLIFSVTRSYYASLAKSGVRIYEYAPGSSTRSNA